MIFPKIYNIEALSDERGHLAVLDNKDIVPFDIKRIYYLYGIDCGVKRGFHAHKKLHQIAICIAGECIMTLDNGKTRKDLCLNNPLLGVDLPPMLWHEMSQFSPDCILLVLASDYYNEGDYIRDYDLFKSIANSY